MNVQIVAGVMPLDLKIQSTSDVCAFASSINGTIHRRVFGYAGNCLAVHRQIRSFNPAAIDCASNAVS
jgi:hypothetical protein